jgi:hypothetical protein
MEPEPNITCCTCFFNRKEYCENKKVVLWDRDAYRYYGVVSIKNFEHTNCNREGKFIGVQFPTVPKYWRDKNDTQI